MKQSTETTYVAGDETVRGEWHERINAFYFAANGREYVACKGSHQVMVYDGATYPAPPSMVLQHTDRVETLDDFSLALRFGKRMQATYTDLPDSGESVGSPDWVATSEVNRQKPSVGEF